jgi:acyl carrier protein
MIRTETYDRVKRVLRDSLKLDDAAPIADDMRLIGGDYDMDSLDVLLIVTNLEKEFGFRIQEGTMDKSAFADVTSLSAYVEQLAGAPR